MKEEMNSADGRPVALPNRHIHLCLCKLGYEVLALLSSDILSFCRSTLWRELSVYSTTRRLRDQNTTQVDNRQGRAGTLYVRLLHLPPGLLPSIPLSALKAVGGRDVYSHPISGTPAPLPSQYGQKELPSSSTLPLCFLSTNPCTEQAVDTYSHG